MSWPIENYINRFFFSIRNWKKGFSFQNIFTTNLKLFEYPVIYFYLLCFTSFITILRSPIYMFPTYLWNTWSQFNWPVMKKIINLHYTYRGNIIKYLFLIYLYKLPKFSNKMTNSLMTVKSDKRISPRDQKLFKLFRLLTTNKHH